MHLFLPSITAGLEHGTPGSWLHGVAMVRFHGNSTFLVSRAWNEKQHIPCERSAVLMWKDGALQIRLM
jgi:hypothetical protein